MIWRTGIAILFKKQEAEAAPYPTLTPAALAAFTQDQYAKQSENAKIKNM